LNLEKQNERMKKTAKCPQCGQSLPSHADAFPFCSKRCQLLDLGKWLGEEYRVPSRADEFSLNDISEIENFQRNRLDADDD
jgi:hypothetical protein